MFSLITTWIFRRVGTPDPARGQRGGNTLGRARPPSASRARASARSDTERATVLDAGTACE